MEDRDFFDLIYQQWARTTGAEDRYWMPEVYEDTSGRNYIWAVGEKTRKQVAKGLKSEDADFIAAIHGCLPDLVRTLKTAQDEADKLDREKDELTAHVAELELEVDGLNARLVSYADRIKKMEESEKESASLVEGLASENRQLEQWLDNGGPDE